jgi:hypothetical protein
LQQHQLHVISDFNFSEKTFKMSFKLTIVFATLAAVSCARLDNDQLARQLQQQQELVQQQNELVQQQNERIRDHQRVENEQRREQIRNLDEQSRRQEQMIRDQQQERLDRIRSNENIFIVAQPQLVPTTNAVHIVTVPSSRRNFDLFDNSNYNFAYAVSDASTGDVKSQNEVRRGDQVQGQYTMMDADGYQRIVEYRADDLNGFDTEVRREPMRSNQQVYASQYRHQQPTIQIISAQQPSIFSTTSVSRRDDGQRSQYSSTTSSNF